MTVAVESAILARARAVIDIEIAGLEALKTQLDVQFLRALELIEQCQGRVVITGMGKSGLIGRKIAATLSSTGTPSFFLHPAEGSHGDSGMMTRQDVVLAISNSGETPELLGILPLIKRLGLPMVAMTARPDATLARQADVWLNIHVPQEACPLGLAPTTSTTATLALGDALAVLLLERKGFTEDDFALFHPSGALGRRLLLTVSDVMHSGPALPMVREETPFIETLWVMTAKKLGLALVVDGDERLLGILTDGDVRRALNRFADPRDIALTSVMTTNPLTIGQDALAESALCLMQERAVTALVILGADQRPVGVVHLHDLLKAGLR
jgi:arabinose-5-phosphate isomerase